MTTTRIPTHHSRPVGRIATAIPGHDRSNPPCTQDGHAGLDAEMIPIPHDVIQDSSISFTARGIFMYLMCDDHVTVDDLLSRFPGERDDVIAAVAELEAHGYVRIGGETR